MRRSLSLGVVVVCLLCLFIFSACASTRRQLTTVKYSIDHQLQDDSNDLAPVSITHGDLLEIEILNTDTSCYTYNAGTEEDHGPEASDTSKATLQIHHNEAVVAYRIRITPLGSCTDARGARDYRIPVRPYWNIAAAGGFLQHDVVDPAYYLKAETPGGSSAPASYRVLRNRDAEDADKIVGAAMLHLYPSMQGWKGLSLAPLSFGVAVDNSRNDYFLGSSLRFGTRAFLSAGWLSTQVNRLPDGLALDGLTDDPNALGSLPKRRDHGFFLALSFKFLDTGMSNLFSDRVGIPAVASKAGAPRQETPKAPTKLIVTPVKEIEGKEITIAFSDAINQKPKLTVGGAPTDVRYEENAVKFTLRGAPGKLALSLFVGEEEVGRGEIEVLPNPDTDDSNQ